VNSKANLMSCFSQSPALCSYSHFVLYKRNQKANEECDAKARDQCQYDLYFVGLDTCYDGAHGCFDRTIQ